MTKYYLQVQANGTITDAITYPYGDYVEYQSDSLPISILGGWFKLENGVIVEHPELKPPDQEQDNAQQITELQSQNAILTDQYNTLSATLDTVMSEVIPSLMA